MGTGVDLGRELVACTLREGTLRPFTEAGITREWLTDQEDITRAAVFATSEDMNAWLTLISYHEQHGKVPSVDMFRRSHPETSYRLPDSAYTPDELIAIFREDRLRILMEAAVGDAADLCGEKKYAEVSELMGKAHRTANATQGSQNIVMAWDGPEYDLEARIHRKITHGIPTGIPGLDNQDGFYGFQKGSLICYLGRAKAGKTSFALLSALAAWYANKRVLFVSFEIAAGKDPNEPGIADRLDCFGAGVDLIHYMQGEAALTKDEQRKLREFRADLGDSAFTIIQPVRSYTVTDLEADIDQHEPDGVYIDGFYFMTDRETGKRGGNWEGHDGLSGELKALGLARRLPVVITHQVREKQLHGKKGKGIDDGAMMGGTGITMAADMVLGADIDDDKRHTLSCTRSRLRYLETVYGTWDWSTCTFVEQAAPAAPDESLYDYGKEDPSDT